MAQTNITLTDSQRSALTWIAILGTFFFLLWLLGNVITPFVVAAVLAYVLDPLVNRVQRNSNYRIGRAAASAIVIILLALLLTAIGLLITPILLDDIPKIQRKIPQLLDQVNLVITPLLDRFGIPFKLEVDTIKSLIGNFIAQSTAPDATNNAANTAAGASTAASNSGATASKVVSTVSLGGMMLLKLLGNLLLIPMILFYFLLDWARILDRAIELVPLPLRKSFIGFCVEADEVLGQYLRGQLSVVLTMAGFYSIGLLLFGLNLAIPVGVFTGLAMAIPYVGFAVGMFLALIAGVLQFGIAKTAIMLAVVYGSGQLLESFYLTPRWVGERIGLHPVTVIFALIAFGELFGFVGLLIALPVSAVLFVAAQQLRLRYFSSSLFTGKNPES